MTAGLATGAGRHQRAPVRRDRLGPRAMAKAEGVA